MVGGALGRGALGGFALGAGAGGGGGVAPPTTVDEALGQGNLFGWGGAGGRALSPVARVWVGGAYGAGAEDLASGLRALAYDPAGAVLLRPTGVEIDGSAAVGELRAATARVTLAEPYAGTLDPVLGQRYPLVIELGFRDPLGAPLYARAFTGWTEALGKASWPYAQELAGEGMLATLLRSPQRTLALRPTAGLAPSEREAAAQVMKAAGVIGFDLDGLPDRIWPRDGRVAGAAAFLGALDREAACCTYDCPDGVVRRRFHPATRTGPAAPSWSFGGTAADAYAILEGARREQQPRESRNRVDVFGPVPDDAETDDAALRPQYTLHDPSNPWVDATEVHRIERIESDLRDQSLCEDAATAWMQLRNKDVVRAGLPTFGNPLLEPMRTAGYHAPELGMTAPVVAAVVGYSHSWTPDRFVSTVQLEDATVGPTGSVLGIGPVATITLSGSGGGVDANGQDSYDADDPDNPEALTYAWENDRTGYTVRGGRASGAHLYPLVVAAEQLPATITLRVVDRDGLKAVTYATWAG